jgi:hypothetical protein
MAQALAEQVRSDRLQAISHGAQLGCRFWKGILRNQLAIQFSCGASTLMKMGICEPEPL